MTKKVKVIIFIFGFLTIGLVANFALAQDFGINEVNNSIGLSQTDPRVIVGRIIQIALSFLGVIALGLIIYAGFLWMTSEGDEEKISKAKQILRNAAIGLVIILASWAITTFLLSRLLEAMGGGGGNIENNGGNLLGGGVGAVGACTVDSFYPTDGQKDVPRNTSIMVTFKEEIDLDSVCVDGQGNSCTCDSTTCNRINPLAIKLYKTELGDACSNSSCPDPNSNVTEVLITIPSGNQTMVLTPLDFLGSPSANTSYTVKLTNRVKKLDGSSMFQSCWTNYTEWKFEVNTSLDLAPPLVTANGVFPIPDNEKDIYREITPAAAAQGSITVNDCPLIFSPAQVNSISPDNAEVVLDYHGPISKFKITVPADTPNKAQLFNGNDNQTLLGIADFDENGIAIFPDYLIFKTTNHPAGSLWEIDFTPEQLADTLTVGSMIYIFATSSENNKIKVPETCGNSSQAANIEAKLSGHPDINVDRNGNIINLTAKVAGRAGNDIILSTTAQTALSLKAFSGGVNLEESSQVKDKQDRPMNSIIQINFNEAINPVTVSGLANEVANYIRVINSATSSPAGEACNLDSDCLSYSCENNVCVGSYINGKFLVSNGYRTVEFISDKECGVNGCGEKIYCLPANSHLAVELVAADLKPCNDDNDCLALSPYKTCSSGLLPYKTCQNDVVQNYPSADPGNLNGIVDAAINSLDGNRDIQADGPLDFYDENQQPEQNINKRDKYKWSFYINDKIAFDPPQITFINPTQGQNGVSLAEPIQINFNTLMMNSSLRTGSTLITSGTNTIEHKLINLRSSISSPLGYWILNDNQDVNPLDGEPDLTVSKIYHSVFNESVTYKAQVGSGVKDIYQNCYKPSVGPNCNVTTENPSCCFGSSTNILGSDGNCP